MANWEIKRIGDIAKVSSSKRIFKSEYSKEGIPFYRSKEVGELHDTGLTNSELFITENRFEDIKKKFGVPIPGDLLLTSVGTIGKTWIVDDRKFYYKDGNLTQLRVNSNFSAKFLQYYFKSPLFIDVVFDKVNGTAYNALTITKIKELAIPCPPLLVQERIVSKLDNLFGKIDKSIELLQKNAVHTRAMMGSVLDEIFKNGNIPIKKVCIISPKKSEVRHLDPNLEVSFLPMRDLNEHQIGFEVKEKKPLGEVYKGYTYFAEEDVILAKVTPCFENGKAGVARNLVNGIGFGSSEYQILRPKDGVISEWIYFALLSEQFRVSGKENMTGSGGLKRVPRKFLENWKIPLPDPEIQKMKINRLKEVQDYTSNLEQEYNDQIRNLEALKKSLLDKAFKGEL